MPPAPEVSSSSITPPWERNLPGLKSICIRSLGVRAVFYQYLDHGKTDARVTQNAAK